MSAGRNAEACPKLEESQRLDPAGGTLLHLAICLEESGKTATAWSLFNSALSAAVRDRRIDRQKVAQEHLALLEPRLSKLVLEVDPAARDLAELRVTRDGI